MYMTYDAIAALPLATRQQLATLRVLARIDRCGFDYTGPVEQLAQLAAINAGDEDDIVGWLNCIDFDEMRDCQDGFAGAFEAIVKAAAPQERIVLWQDADGNHHWSDYWSLKPAQDCFDHLASMPGHVMHSTRPVGEAG